MTDLAYLVAGLFGGYLIARGTQRTPNVTLMQFTLGAGDENAHEVDDSWALDEYRKRYDKSREN